MGIKTLLDDNLHIYNSLMCVADLNAYELCRLKNTCYYAIDAVITVRHSNEYVAREFCLYATNICYKFFDKGLYVDYMFEYFYVLDPITIFKTYRFLRTQASCAFFMVKADYYGSQYRCIIR
jgi:hypothetical protein